MKFGVSSYSFSKYIMQTKCDYFKICDIAKEIGYDGIEFINLDNKNWGITEDPIKTAGEIKEYCAKIGLDIIAYTVGANFMAENIDEEQCPSCLLVFGGGVFTWRRRNEIQLTEKQWLLCPALSLALPIYYLLFIPTLTL